MDSGDKIFLKFILCLVSLTIGLFIYVAIEQSEIDKENKELEKSIRDLSCLDLSDNIMKNYLKGGTTKSQIYLDEFELDGCKFDLVNPIILEKMK